MSEPTPVPPAEPVPPAISEEAEAVRAAAETVPRRGARTDTVTHPVAPPAGDAIQTPAASTADTAQEQVGAAADTAKQAASSAAESAQSSVSSAAESVQSSVSSAAESVQGSVSSTAESVQSSVSAAVGTVIATTDKRPEILVGAGFAGGFVIAMVLKRLGH